MSANELVVERRDQENETAQFGSFMLTPHVSDNYWSYRVMLSKTQAILAFPKFHTIGIGFAQEEDWSTNLPYTCAADEIWDHIKHNKGDDSINDESCLAAISMLQDAIREDRS